MPSRSRKSQQQRENRRVIDDVRMLAALSHPVRIALLTHLLELGPATATDCAPAVGASPSACSYHLRHLERFGLVERVEDDQADGRNRPWRASYTGYSIGPLAVPTQPMRRRAAYAVIGAGLERNVRLAEQYLRQAGTLPEEWQEAAEFASYGITVTADELSALTNAMDELIRPYITPVRADVPSGAERVHVTLHAFRRLRP
jgi:DNA-binding transcriptional ArsR family regulator